VYSLRYDITILLRSKVLWWGFLVNVLYGLFLSDGIS